MMETQVITITEPQDAASRQAIYSAARMIEQGQLVAFPTETVYGLGANALDAEACSAIYTAKGRPADNPLIVHIADLSMLYALAEPSELALTLARAFMPGPLTLVLPKKPIVPAIVSSGLPTVAIRWPAHPVAEALIQECCRPIAAPSANASGCPSPTTAAHVYTDLAGKIPLILDGGPVDIGLESTVVDVCGERPLILRPGRVGAEEIADICGKPVGWAGQEDAMRPASPGMKYRHYAPHGELHLAQDIKQLLLLREQMLLKYGQEPLLLVCKETAAELPPQAHTYVIAQRGDVVSYAQKLFAALRQGDAAHYAALVAETVPEQGIGIAIMNRLRKAANRL